MTVIQPRLTHVLNYQCAKFGDYRTSFNVLTCATFNM